ncbi:GAK system XXXCH domain-containing protein [Nitratidesulfovibrio sp. HK-II]|uniref:GAK system XXXCH domain-containing protein n=1 Tax=Nitratidesulfovibrio sp. HK-II TaxID=2009266 RepID=UPI001558D23B|nr:GAK system XXXCH domain-containing protein [Nitratidesulfovibrio sp. HK-II]
MGSRKTSFSITRQELPAVLRRIAGALERDGAAEAPAGGEIGGETDPLLAAGLGEFRKFKLNAKHAFDHMEVVLKVKTPDASAFGPDAAGAAATDDGPGGARASRLPHLSGRPSYKSLKKRMRSSFKALRQAVQAGTMPHPEAAASFLADSLLMVEYPGYGDEHYAAYRTATEALRAALEAARQTAGAQPGPSPDAGADAPHDASTPTAASPVTPTAAPPITPEVRHAVEELYRLMVLCHDRYK